MTARTSLAALALALAACAPRGTFLGAKLPDACRGKSVSIDGPAERCAGWISDRVMVVGADDRYGDEVLQTYVQGVANRLADANHLDRPIVTVVDEGTSAAVARPGNYVYVWRELLPAFDTEAELAAVLAHEMAHQAAGHTADMLDAYAATVDGDLQTQRSRDDEAIADELAVTYLAAAGYAPDAVRTALLALDRATIAWLAAWHGKSTPAGPAAASTDAAPDTVSSAAALATTLPEPPEPPIVDERHAHPRALDPDDLYHPVMAERIARVSRVIDGRTAGELGGERFRERLVGLIVGDDVRRGMQHHSRWLVARAGLAIDLPPEWNDKGEESGPTTELSAKHEATVSLVGKVWGDAIASQLRDRGTRTIAGYPAVTGMGDPIDDQGDARPRPPMDAQLHGPRPSANAAFAIITVGDRALAMYVTGPEAIAKRDYLVGRTRAITDEELALVVPRRIAFVPAPRAATLGELVPELCKRPVETAPYTDNARRVEAGALVKCVE
jgi:hypothetical protein